MDIMLSFMAAFVFKIAASQTFTHSALPGTSQVLTLRCETIDFASTVYFKQNSDSKGGCLVNGNCDTGIPGYQTPTRKETTITEMKITSCDETRDIGNWSCTYGGSTSPPVAITKCSGVATTEELSTTQHDVTTGRLLTNDYTTTIQNTDTICTTTICISIAALLSLIALFIIASLLLLLVLCCTGRLTCILPHAFHKKNTSETSIQNSNDKHENRQSYKTGSENEHRIYKGDGRTNSYQLKTDNQFRNESYSVDENEHQSKNTHVVTSDSSQSKRNYLPSTEYKIKNTKNPNTRDNRHVHNRGYYDTNW